MTLAIDQANLGHDTIGPVRLVLMRSDDKLEIQELRVALPGGSRGELQGTIFDTPGQAVVFDGNLALRGTSVARFLTWAAGNALPIDAEGRRRFRPARADHRRQRQGRGARHGRQPVRNHA